MIKVLEQVIAKVGQLSPERQRYAAEVLAEIADAGDEIHQLSEEEERLLQVAIDELDRGERATKEQARAVFDKYR